MDQIRGMVLPLPTVFDHAGQIDKPVMRQMIDYYVASGINAIFVGGSMGQGMAMTQEERKALFELSVEAVNNRVPVLAHVGTADPYTTIDLGKHALKVGADALAIVGPYYYSDRSHAELRAHFKMVGEALQAPILLYNNPKYQGYPMPGELMKSLVEVAPQIFGCKMALGSINEMIVYQGTLGAGFRLFAMASSLFPGLRFGLGGTISPPLTLCPEIGVACVRASDEGDDARALELQRAICDLQGALVSPEVRKVCGRAVFFAGLRELGFDVKIYPRWPVAEVPAEGFQRIRATLERARSALRQQAA
jgi:dihydrodipicolinate synthase/N-acetylneuraminate lyase